jgi:hypothetical protein
LYFFHGQKTFEQAPLHLTIRNDETVLTRDSIVFANGEVAGLKEQRHEVGAVCAIVGEPNLFDVDAAVNEPLWLKSGIPACGARGSWEYPSRTSRNPRSVSGVR